MFLAQVINPESVSYGMLFAKTMIAVIIIIVLAFLSIRYVLPYFMKMRRKSDSQIQVVDFQAIDQKKAVYLIKIREKLVALAASEHAFEKLAEWDENERTSS